MLPAWRTAARNGQAAGVRRLDRTHYASRSSAMDQLNEVRDPRSIPSYSRVVFGSAARSPNIEPNGVQDGRFVAIDHRDRKDRVPPS